MRNTLLGVVCGLVLAACAHSQGSEPPLAPPPPPAGEASGPERMAEPARPPVYVDPPESRPRLSRTLTLGQGAEAPYQPSAAPGQGSQSSQGVVVNNTVIVQGGYPGGYGGYPAYGYGYGGYRGSYGARAAGSPDARGRTTQSAPSMWSTTGWEGARRTAAPGQTPGVGGNWSSPPSSGPSQMK